MSGGGSPPPAESFADQAFAAAASAYADTPESWERAVQAAIAGLFEFLVERPRQTRACIEADCGAGPPALARRDRAIERFTELLAPGFAAAPAPPPAIVAEAIAGGIYELIRSYVLEGRLHELPDVVPDATVVALSPFLGAAGAVDLVSSTKLRTGR
ncbi:MAG TPA: hypothetical protein VHF90_08990 [Thermoleophilaceae bacterium]|nr:hypothetical protein [Thermoleophilaceae bacterium]